MTHPHDTGHSVLRKATADCHRRLDDLFGDFELTAVESYTRFLCAHYAAAASVETALDDAGVAQLLPDWPDRRRAERIRQDLAALQTPLPAMLACPPLADAGACWGAAYVLEGSRLGGMLLARRVPGYLPKTYLSAEQPAGAWPAFLKSMNKGLSAPPLLASAAAAGVKVFELFETSGRNQLANAA